MLWVLIFRLELFLFFWGLVREKSRRRRKKVRSIRNEIFFFFIFVDKGGSRGVDLDGRICWVKSVEI